MLSERAIIMVIMHITEIPRRCHGQYSILVAIVLTTFFLFSSHFYLVHEHAGRPDRNRACHSGSRWAHDISDSIRFGGKAVRQIDHGLRPRRYQRYII